MDSAIECGSHVSHDRVDGSDHPGASWYLSRREIEENSPSRGDGIDFKKEAYLRKSYCTFLQDLGMKLKVPQVTIATAIIFCHRFFLRQSHAKNDRRTIATVCMFLAGKVEETPRPLKDVILVSYEIIHKKDPIAVQKIKQKEVYEHQKELILLAERVVLATLDFDFNVHHPYKPLVDAIKKFKVAQNALAQVAWNFVNDGLRTSLCLQFKPHHIAAGAIFLAAKFLKVKLPSDGEKVWWQEFYVTPRQLEEVSNQMLELYEQNRTPSHGTETEGNSAGTSNNRGPSRSHASVDESAVKNGNPPSAAPVKHNKTTTSSSSADQQHIDGLNGTYKAAENKGKEFKTSGNDNRLDDGRDRSHHGGAVHRVEKHVDEPLKLEKGVKGEGKDSSSSHVEGPKGYSPMVPINKDKVKAALEKRRKSRNDVSRKIDLMDDDDLIERELEDGVELAAEDGKSKQDRKHSWSKPLYGQEPLNAKYGTENDKDRNVSSAEPAEEGELSFDNGDFHSPEHGNRKRKVTSPHRQLPLAKRQDVLEDEMVSG